MKPVNAKMILKVISDLLKSYKPQIDDDVDLMEVNAVCLFLEKIVKSGNGNKKLYIK